MIVAVRQSTHYKWWAFFAVAIGTFASVADQVGVNVALHPIAGHFNSDIPTVQWVVISYTLTISALLLPMGRLSDIVGLKKVYIIGSVVFALFGIGAAVSDNLGLLIGSRVIQGAGAAMTQGTGMAIVAASFPASERGKAIGLVMGVVSSGAIVGPALGGFLLDLFGWRAVFLVNVPLIVLCVALSLAVLSDQNSAGPSSSGQKRSGFDWQGATLSTGMLLIFLLTITYAHRFGWTSAPIMAGLVGFVILLACFIWWELRTPNPMLELRYFRMPVFSCGVSAAFLTFMGGISIFFLTPFYLQGVLGYSPTQTGLTLVPGAVCMLFLGPVSGRLSDRYGWRALTVSGLAFTSVSLFILSRLTVDSSLALILPALILQSCGMGLFFSPNASSVLSSVSRESYGVISAFLNLVRNAGNVVSIAVATAIVTATMGSMGFEPSLSAVTQDASDGVGHAFTSGLRYTYLGMTCLMVVAMGISALRGRPREE
ncbi:MAG: MFS transporter [Chloroflexi bacterium]|nr:MFS transporter [Chloroflexota bacterium]